MQLHAALAQNLNTPVRQLHAVPQLQLSQLLPPRHSRPRLSHQALAAVVREKGATAEIQNLYVRATLTDPTNALVSQPRAFGNVQVDDLGEHMLVDCPSAIVDRVKVEDVVRYEVQILHVQVLEVPAVVRDGLAADLCAPVHAADVKVLQGLALLGYSDQSVVSYAPTAGQVEGREGRGVDRDRKLVETLVGDARAEGQVKQLEVPELDSDDLQKVVRDQITVVQVQHA
mmetsp:Transcript_14382/g.26494  ORF Transcript_14382/g.26494 Transcript_14382/m.26494 type:complete len:229 (-) Transcript_14382:3144-3830(-)